ncbi:MAG: DUF2784 domain-containing protein [Gammaproteobacteria bacterium]
MLDLILADIIVAIHFAFIVFVVLGGLAVFKWRRCIWLHLPAVLWGALIEFAGWICPLTRFENRLRSTSGGGYSSGFIEHYLIPVIYPSGLTRELQIGLGVSVILFNLILYKAIFNRWRKSGPKTC